MFSYNSALKAVSATAICLGIGTAALAADAVKLPENISIVVAYPAGSATDVAARIIAHGLQKELNINVVVDNRPGGSGEVGSAHVARAKPTGATLLFATSSIVVQEAVKKQVSFAASKDLEAIALISSYPQFLVTHPGMGTPDLAAFVEKIKAAPGKHYYSSSGLGGIQHAELAAFSKIVGLDVTHVPFSGGAPSRLDLMAGRAAFSAVPPDALNSEKSLVILAALGKERSPFFPDVPTIAEAGYPQLTELSSWLTWLALMAPTGTPTEVTNLLNEKVNVVLQDPEILERFKILGQETHGGTSREEAQAFFVKEAAEWKKAGQFIDLNLD